MKIKKFLVIAIAILFFINYIPVTSSIKSEKNYSLEESYVINDFPYIGQETNFYCAYASYAMVFNYLADQNITLDEMLFLSGVGYSSFYSNESLTRTPMIGTILCQSPDYISKFFGYSDCMWYPKEINDISQLWDRYWNYVKENITRNNPVITTINPFRISSFRNLVDFHIPDWLISIGPKSGHAIVIVGFNESNQSVCFNDPAMGYFGRPDLGKYAWMNLTLFEQSLIDVMAMPMANPFFIISFEDNESKCLSKEERFLKAFNLNIEKLKGNSSTFDPELFEFVENYLGYSNYGIGINATKSYLQNLGNGLNNQFITMQIYKKIGKFGIKYKLINRLVPRLLEKLDLPSSSGGKFTSNNFDIISIEKNYTANFLKENGLNKQANLFYDESENWTKLANLFNIFMEKGLLLSNKKSISAINDMYYALGNILSIQQKILENPILDIDFKILEFINRNHVSSISAGIIKNNTLEWYGGYGSYTGINTRFFDKTPNKDTIYMAGSISKTITATAIMQLYEKGLLDIDDDVNLYLPFSLRNPNFPDKNITIRMLLNHSSGLSGSSLKSLIKSGLSYVIGYPINYLKSVLLEDGLLYSKKVWRNDSAPGYDYQYANMGFVVLECIVEQVSELSFEGYCKENIFDPLEMYNSSFHFKDFKKNLQAPAYIWKYGIFIRLPHYDVPMAGAGSLRTSIEDLSHFLIAHMNKGLYKGKKILNETNIELMHNFNINADDFQDIAEIYNIPNYVESYGLGWMNYNSSLYNRNLSGHDGDAIGTHAVMRMDQDNMTGLIFFWNSNAKIEGYDGPWNIHLPMVNILLEKIDSL